MRLKAVLDPQRALRPLRVARMLAIAHAMKQKLESGEVTDFAELSSITGLSKGRISQLLDLTYLAPDIQEAILVDERLPGRDPIYERQLRHVVRKLEWNEQREMCAALIQQERQ